MRNLWLRLAIVFVLGFGVAGAQLAPPNEVGVTFGHLHIRSRNTAEHLKFWRDLLGGKQGALGAMPQITLPGIQVLLQEADAGAGTAGSTINHVGFRVRDLAGMVAKTKEAGFKVTSENPQRALAFIDGPDMIRVEYLEDKSLTVPVSGGHIHIYAADEASIPELEAWYIKVFGGSATKRGNYREATFPGTSVAFAVSKTPVTPTKGRALDHIGFDVKNLEAYCKKLEAQGIKLDVPYRVVKNLSLAIAFVTDPRGTSIELSEPVKID
jgi:catechol 2,3-dioxygenase-like lactoylglutathione lyase family enzyme